MRRLETWIAVGLMLLVAGTASAAGKGKGKGHPVRGTVESVTPESVVVKVPPNKKTGGEASNLSFQLNDKTQYEFMTRSRKAKGEKPTVETKPASFTDVKTGEHVMIVAPGTVAEKVSIVQGGRGKNKPE